MAELKLTKTGLWVEEFNYDRWKAANAVKKVSRDGPEFFDRSRPNPDAIFVQLRKSVEVEPGVTVKDVFDVVETYPLLKNFMKQYSWCHGISAFHDNAAKTVPKTNEYVDLEYTEIHATGEMMKTRRDGNWCTFGWDFHGYGKAKQADEGIEKDEMMCWSISASPVHEYAHVPLRIDDTVKIRQVDMTAKNKVVATEIFEGKLSLSLLELLDAIYWDISFYGSPADNEALTEELRDAVAEIKADVAAGKIDDPDKYPKMPLIDDEDNE